MTSLSRLKIVLLVPAVVGAGCSGPDHDALCQQEVECIGGNDKDKDACVAYRDYTEDAASDVGCTDEYEARFECFEGAVECDTQDTMFGCASNADCDQIGGGTCGDGTCKRKAFFEKDPEACRAEKAAFNRCAPQLSID